MSEHANTKICQFSPIRNSRNSNLECFRDIFNLTGPKNFNRHTKEEKGELSILESRVCQNNVLAENEKCGTFTVRDALTLWKLFFRRRLHQWGKLFKRAGDEKADLRQNFKPE